jgi:carbon storage regulator
MGELFVVKSTFLMEESVMLVLSRKKNESIVLGEGENQIVLSVIEIRGDKVRLGIQANPKIPVHRKEIYEQIQKEKEKDGTKNVQ